LIEFVELAVLVGIEVDLAVVVVEEQMKIVPQT